MSDQRGGSGESQCCVSLIWQSSISYMYILGVACRLRSQGSAWLYMPFTCWGSGVQGGEGASGAGSQWVPKTGVPPLVAGGSLRQQHAEV